MSTFGPITTLFKLGQLLNAFLLSSSFVLSSNCMLRRLSQQLKAQDLIEVVVRGILYSFIPQGKDINSVFDALYSAVPSEEKFSFPSSTDMDSSELQPENTLDSTVLREAGNVMAFNEEQPAKAPALMVHNPLGSFICLKEVHPEKTSVPSVSNPEGNFICLKEVHPEKA